MCDFIQVWLGWMGVFWCVCCGLMWLGVVFLAMIDVLWRDLGVICL